MAADYQIDETESELIFHVPPPTVVWKVAAATMAAGTSLWYGFVCFYLWLARSDSTFSFVYCIASNALFVVLIRALVVLYRQLSKKEVIFEKYVVGIDYRILGMRVQRRWISIYSVQQWVMEPAQGGQKLMLAIRYQDRVITLVETLDYDLWIALVIRMQRREFVYV